MSDSQWKQYIEERESHEDGDVEEEAEEEEREEDEEVDGVVPASRIIPRIRSSVVATLKSTALKLDTAAFARGVFLVDHDMNDVGEGEPRTVESHARINAPNATGTFVDLFYRNHHELHGAVFGALGKLWWARHEAGSSWGGQLEKEV